MMQSNNNSQKIKSFTDLYSWQEGHKLVLEVYKETKQFPDEERFGLTNQLRRAAVSITSNVAEGFSRSGKQEKKNFYSTALGSLAEVQNQLLIARDMGYITDRAFKELADKTVAIDKMLNGLIKTAETRTDSSA